MNTEQQAQLLEEIATVIRERPEDWWRGFEGIDFSKKWKPFESASDVFAALGSQDVRRRPRTITIAGEISREAAEEIKSRAAGVPGEAGRKWREIAALIREVE